MIEEVNSKNFNHHLALYIDLRGLLADSRELSGDAYRTYVLMLKRLTECPMSDSVRRALDDILREELLRADSTGQLLMARGEHGRHVVEYNLGIRLYAALLYPYNEISVEEFRRVSGDCPRPDSPFADFYIVNLIENH